MKGFNDTLRRIDQEIDQRRREIAVHQVEIVRLEDSRKVLMRLADDDIAAAQMQRGEQQSLGHSSHAKPMLIVRQTTEDEAPLGIVASGKRKGMPRMRRARGGQKMARGGSSSGKMRDLILDAIKPGDQPITSSTLGDQLGLAEGQEARKPMQNALYVLRTTGKLLRDDQLRYYRPAPNGAH
jgi:hypothetical protein